VESAAPPAGAAILQCHPGDNVAIALRPLVAGETVGAGTEGDGRQVEVRNPVPLYHKVSLGSIRQGDAVLKHGEVIGQASRDIGPGSHVHVHNIVSCRARFQPGGA
jgi:altronate dehydratase